MAEEWREIISPHKDVASGKYMQAEFAADLAQVYQNRGSQEYLDPAEFFSRTFITVGLRDLLSGAIKRLSGEGSDPVLELQTNFGGGKTHSMLALYHLFGGVETGSLEGIEPVLSDAGLDVAPKANRAVLVGTALSPGETSIKDDGTEVRTLWGEMAWQLGGDKGKIALDTLKNIFTRVAKPWRSATSDEGFEIVRRRLFEPIRGKDAFANRDATINAYSKMYRAGDKDFPRECGEKTYADEMRACYPIHPELFHRLYEDWSTLDKFQRTRGVLRLLAKVIHRLWESNDAGLLIAPASMPMDDSAVKGELIRYLYDVWEPIIRQDGNRYWLSTHPNLNRTAEDRASELLREPDTLFAEVVSRLQNDRKRGAFAGVHICPQDTSDVPDDPSARLVILHPDYPHGRKQAESKARTAAESFLSKRGNSPRLNKNCLVFLAPNGKNLEALKTTTAQFLAWSSILRDKQSLNLDQHLWKKVNHVTVAELAEWFPRYLYLRRLTDREVLTRAIQDGPHDDVNTVTTASAPKVATAPVKARPKAFFGAVALNGSRVGRDAGRIADEVLGHLTELPGAKVSVSLEISIKVPGGVDSDVVRIVSENASALKFNDWGFEDE